MSAPSVSEGSPGRPSGWCPWGGAGWGMIEHGFDAGGSVGMDEVAAAWGNLTASRLEFLSELAALDRERGFEYDGHTSTAAFLMHRCGMSARRARREVFLARSLERMRLVWSSVASGRLSFDQAVVLAFAQHRPPRPLRRRRGNAHGTALPNAP